MKVAMSIVSCAMLLVAKFIIRHKRSTIIQIIGKQSRLAIIIMLSFSSLAHSQEIPDNFVYIREVIPDLVLDVRYFSDANFIGERITGYEAERLIISAQAGLALKKVQDELAYAGLGLKVFDAYRPQRAVDHFVRWANDPQDLRKQKEYYPQLNKSELIPSGYIAVRSGHSRGSTVDLTIIMKETGAELDMGSPFDYFDPVSWPSATTVSPQQRANRLLLRSLMGKHGFNAIEEEWWHFTLENEPYPDTYFDFPVR